MHWQLPCTQVAVMGHTFPHLPQLAVSVFVSAHMPLHMVVHGAASTVIIGPASSSTMMGAVAHPRPRKRKLATEIKCRMTNTLSRACGGNPTANSEILG